MLYLPVQVTSNCIVLLVGLEGRVVREGVTKTLCRYKIRVKLKTTKFGFPPVIKYHFNPVGDTDKSINLKEFPGSPVADDRYCLADSFVTIKVLHFLSRHNRPAVSSVTPPPSVDPQDINRNIFLTQNESSGFNYYSSFHLKIRQIEILFPHQDCMLISLI